MWEDEVNDDIIKEVNQAINETRILNFDPEFPHFKLGTTDHWEPGEDRYLEMMANGRYDSQFDLFSISAPGISGSFILKMGDQTPGQGSLLIPKIEIIGPSSFEVIPDWEIGYVTHKEGYNGPNPQVVLGINSFIVKTPDGTTYLFTKKVVNGSHVLVSQTGVNYKRTIDVNNSLVVVEENIMPKPEEKIENESYTSAWLLEKVETGVGDIISFDYESDFLLCKSLKKQKLSNTEILQSFNNFIGTYPKDVETSYTFVQEVNCHRLTKITTQTGQLILNYNKNIKNPQCDLNALTGINFYQFGKFFGSVQFKYGYLLRDGGTWLLSQNGNVPPITRLVLNELSFFDSYGNSQGPNKFSYFDGDGLDSGGFPSYDNLHLDHWGYPSNRPHLGDYFDDGNRRFEGEVWSLPNTRLGLIKELEKPDGTKIKFEYENNSSFENLMTSTFSKEMAGGLKVVKISRKSKVENEPERSREFRYGRRDQPFTFDYLASTWLGGFPLYAQKNDDPSLENSSNITYQKSTFHGTILPSLNEGLLKIPRFLRKNKMVQSTPVYQLEDELGRSVVYTRVLEKSESDEFILYEFMEPEMIADGLSRISSGYKRPQPLPNSTMPNWFVAWCNETFNSNVLLNPLVEILEGNQSRPYNGNLGGLLNINSLPDEISKFGNYANRHIYSRQLNL